MCVCQYSGRGVFLLHVYFQRIMWQRQHQWVNRKANVFSGGCSIAFWIFLLVDRACWHQGQLTWIFLLIPNTRLSVLSAIHFTVTVDATSFKPRLHFHSNRRSTFSGFLSMPKNQCRTLNVGLQVRHCDWCSVAIVTVLQTIFSRKKIASYCQFCLHSHIDYRCSGLYLLLCRVQSRIRWDLCCSP